MYERVNLLKLFFGIDEAIRRIERQFDGISEPDDLILNDDGLDRLDGISIMLIAIVVLNNLQRVLRLCSALGIS